MNPGRNMYASKGSPSSAFSVRPLTRAHMDRPPPELSVPAPETYMNFIRGFVRLRISAAAFVNPYVTRS